MTLSPSSKESRPVFSTTPNAAKSRRRPRLADAVVEDLVNTIVTEIYPPGSTLPPENILCDMYEVSRTVIREATTALTEKGLVVSQQGRGTLIQEPNHWNLLDPLILAALFQREDGLSYLDNLSEIRATLEASMAAKAARNLTPETGEELARQMEALEGLVDNPAGYAHEDLKFHDIIMNMSGDRLSKAIIDSIQGKARKTFGYAGRFGLKHIRATHEAHRNVFNAIMAGNPEAASKAMQEHIETSWLRRRPLSAKKTE